MGHTTRTLIILIISSFIILPLVLPLVIVLLNRFEEKAVNSMKAPGKDYGTLSLLPRTIIYSGAIGLSHAFYFFPNEKFYMYAAIISFGTLLVFMSNKYIFTLVMTVLIGGHFTNIFYFLFPSKVPFLPPPLSVTVLFAAVFFFPLNKLYGMFSGWNRTFRVSPNQVKKTIAEIKHTDERVMEADSFFYDSEQNSAIANPRSALFIKLQDQIKNYNTFVFRKANFKDAVSMSDSIRWALTDVDRRFILSKRDFYYFLIIIFVVYGLYFLSENFGRFIGL